jgi:hypothetical protein
VNLIGGPYIRRFSHITDEYTIFVGDVAEPMNIWGSQVKSDDSYIRRCPAQINEYSLIYVGFKTNEYNLNIFVSIDEYIIADE